MADRNGPQHSQKCPPRGHECQTGSNNDKGIRTEENEVNKSAVNEEEPCAKNHHGWKGFSLKRQLSKVDLKIKSTFSPALLTSQNGVLVCFFFFFFVSSVSSPFDKITLSFSLLLFSFTFFDLNLKKIRMLTKKESDRGADKGRKKSYMRVPRC